MLPVNDNRVEKVIELSKESLDAFCDDISTMFEVDMSCKQLESTVADLKTVKKHFKKVAAVHTVQADGALEGTFQLVFDQGGLFTLAGVIVMLPAKRIVEEAKRGSLAEAEGMSDAVGEVGNLLIGTWDRIFREELEGHKHFRKTHTFIGNPWDDPTQIAGLADSDQYHFVRYEITVESYSSFQCASLIPAAKARVAPAEKTVAKDATPEKPQEETVPEETANDAALEAELAGETPATVEATESPIAAEETDGSGPETEPTLEVEAELEEPRNEQGQETTTAEERVSEEVQVEQATHTDAAEAEMAAASESLEEGGDVIEVAAPEIVTVTTPAAAPVAQPVAQQPVQMTGRVLGSDLSQLMSLTAKQVMSTEIVWAEPTATVSEVLSSMQQHDVGYVLVGKQGSLQGLVSKSNIMGAMSPYLRPVFSKWRRPADDATMEIMVQWVMSRPVRTVQPGASLAVVIEQMRQFGGRCLPVVDAAGKVHGMVTVFDVLRVITPDMNTRIIGRTPQAPCLMV